MSQTRDQKCFTFLKAAADWHEPMVMQGIMWPSIACANGLGPTVQLADTPSPQSATLGLHPVAVANSFPIPLRVGGRVGLSTQ